MKCIEIHRHTLVRYILVRCLLGRGTVKQQSTAQQWGNNICCKLRCYLKRHALKLKLGKPFCVDQKMDVIIRRVDVVFSTDSLLSINGGSQRRSVCICLSFSYYNDVILNNINKINPCFLKYIPNCSKCKFFLFSL